MTLQEPFLDAQAAMESDDQTVRATIDVHAVRTSLTTRAPLFVFLIPLGSAIHMQLSNCCDAGFGGLRAWHANMHAFALMAVDHLAFPFFKSFDHFCT